MILKKFILGLSMEGSNFILSSLEDGHWAAQTQPFLNKWSEKSSVPSICIVVLALDIEPNLLGVVKYTKWPRINMTWQSGFLLKFDACCYWKWSLRRHLQIMMLAITNQDWLPNSSVQFRFLKKTAKFNENSQLNIRLFIKFYINWKISPTFCGLLRKPELYVEKRY